MMRRDIGAFATLLLVACPRGNEPSAKSVANTTAPASGDADELGPVERVRRATTAHMCAHFGDILEIHTSLIRGSLGEAKAAAVELAQDRPRVMLDEWAPHLLALRTTAEDLGRARSIDEAAALAAALAKTCGDCHEAQGARLAPLSGPPPAKSDDNAARMRRHAWAFNRLWEGLVLPSDESWMLGVDAFVDLPDCEDHVSPESDRAAIAHAREVMTSSEATARSATTREDRARVYGQMLPTCAACHASGC